MNPTESKIRNVSKKMSVVLKVGGIITSIISLLAVIAICILVFSSESTRLSFLTAFDITANNGTVISLTTQSLLVMFSWMIVDSVLLTVIIYFVYAIFRDMGKGCTPFSHKNTTRIKQIAIVSIVLSFIGGFSDALVDYYTIGKLTWNVDFAGLLVGVVIYCLALIFHYGCELQKQSDETL